jgi:hypothetical protein
MSLAIGSYFLTLKDAGCFDLAHSDIGVPIKDLGDVSAH